MTHDYKPSLSLWERKLGGSAVQGQPGTHSGGSGKGMIPCFSLNYGERLEGGGQERKVGKERGYRDDSVA